MRLKCIRLAGFKSFVDPTTVNFPSNMAAVVGPNGCGKSNIIDAVRWVMGESSAKNLRGESMTDVIFNGSSGRKPVSQASIELVFDNSETTLLGEYAAYAEISIRRKVTRDGQNTYYLNGTKCRRRDITDIFLGTGLGPRSYSIIEQGMISKLIEAKPEELRNFIEEAAGISKYKERRRETESRIRRTQENLARLTDLREELERQLERLHRQAQAAEKYREYKARERQLKARLSALRWRELDERVRQREAVIGDQEVAFEALVAEQRNADASIERLRDGHHELSERFNQVQGRFYSVAGDIARVEQSIQHGQQRLRQLQDDLKEAERTRLETESHLGHDRTLLATLGEELAMLEPEQELTLASAEEATATLEEAELGMHAWQEQWDSFNTQSAEPRRQAEVQQSRLQQLEAGLERLAERQRKLEEEREQLAAEPEDAALFELTEQVASSELELETLQMSEQQVLEQLDAVREQLQQATETHQQSQGELQRLGGRLASLEALQQAARSPVRVPVTGCAAKGWSTSRGWLKGCGSSQAGSWRSRPCWVPICKQCWSKTSPHWISLPGAGRTAAAAGEHAGARLPGSLLDKVEGRTDLAPWLGQVRPVESLEQALALRAGLAEGQSLVSRDGYWIGRHFCGSAGAGSPKAGFWPVARKSNAWGMSSSNSSRVWSNWSNTCRTCADNSATEAQREQLRRRSQDENRQLGELKARLSAGRARAEQVQLRCRRLQEELAELQEQRAMEHEQLGEARLLLQEAPSGWPKTPSSASN